MARNSYRPAYERSHLSSADAEYLGSQSGASQLATLGRHRPPDVIKAELASAAVPLHIWRRSRHCLDLTLEESRLACAPVLGLRKELASAEHLLRKHPKYDCAAQGDAAARQLTDEADVHVSMEPEYLYRVFYTVKGQQVFVIRILHGRQG